MQNTTTTLNHPHLHDICNSNYSHVMM